MYYIHRKDVMEMKKSMKITALILSLMISMCSFGISSFALMPEIHSPSAILTDINSDEILYQKGAYKEVLPSVSAKFMAIYTAISSDAKDTVVVEKEWLESLTNDRPRMSITSGETYSLKDIIRCVYLTDFYDVYLCLVNHIGSSEKGFVNMMNANARKLGMVNTHYETVSGYGEGEEYTTPYDVHFLMKALCKDPVFKEITKDTSYTVNESSKKKNPFKIRQKLNINDPQSEWYISGSKFAKMDSYKKYGHSIVFSVLRDNREILWVSFGSESQDICATEAGEAVEFAFSDYKRVIYTKEEIRKLFKGEKNLYIEPTSDIYVTVPSDVEKANLIATVKEEDRIATFRVAGNGVSFEKEVSKVRASGLRFIGEGILMIIRWILAGIIAIIVLICILYIPISMMSLRRAKKLRERKEEKVRRLKEKMKENE